MDSRHPKVQIFNKAEEADSYVTKIQKDSHKFINAIDFHSNKRKKKNNDRIYIKNLI